MKIIKLKINIIENENEVITFIESNDLCISYTNFINIHGLQCNFEADTNEYLELEKILVEISDLIRILIKNYQ